MSEPFDWPAAHAHLAQVRGCRLCPTVEPPPVAAMPRERPRMLLVGQAPGPREREVGYPFAFTAGTRLFSWFARLGVPEEEFRAKVWMSAVVRCFPGRAPQGGTGRRGRSRPPTAPHTSSARSSSSGR